MYVIICIPIFYLKLMYLSKVDWERMPEALSPLYNAYEVDTCNKL